MSDENKTHFRKAFKSCYLAAVDITEELEVTIKHVVQERDASKKTSDQLLVAYFKEPEIRKGEKLKPMVINATNAKMVNSLAGSPFIEDWVGTSVVIYVDENVRFGRETVEGLRLRKPSAKPKGKPFLTPENEKMWANAIAAYKRDGNLDKVLERVQISDDHVTLIQSQAAQGDENAVA